jgi:hypothetical protein
MRRRELVLGAVVLGMVLSAHVGQVTYAETPPACLPPELTGLDPRLPCAVPLNVEVESRGVTLRWNAAAAETLMWNAAADTVRAFGGYKIWRWRVPRGYAAVDPSNPGLLLPDTSSYTLLQVIAVRDSNAARTDTTAFDLRSSFREPGRDWVFHDPDDLFTFEKANSLWVGPGGVTDSVWYFETVPRTEAGPINGFGYFYAVTYFGVVFDSTFGLGESIIAGLSSKMPNPDDGFVFPVYPGGRPAENLENVLVIPNPYSNHAAWEFFGQKKMQFVNLPDFSTVEIFTAAGDFIRRLRLEAGARGTGDVNTLDWNLRSEVGEEVTAGIYIFRVEAPNGRDTIGRFVVIR